MYLVSVYEKNSVVEASLGGRVDAEEVRIFGEELLELAESFGGQPFYVLLDYSKARRLDGAAVRELGWIKDRCLETGAEEIVSVALDERDRVAHQSDRLQQVLEGRERFVGHPTDATFAPVPVRTTLRLAA